MPSLVRLNVNINAKAANVLTRKPRRYRYRPWKPLPKLPLTERVRRAVAMYKYFEDEAQKGNQIRVVNKFTGKIRELCFD